MKIVRLNGIKYRIKGYSHGASPNAIADFYYPKGIMKGWHEVKNLCKRRRLAIMMGKHDFSDLKKR